MQRISRFIQDESGQDVVEYGLLIATIAIVVLIGVGIFGQNINTSFRAIINFNAVTTWTIKLQWCCSGQAGETANTSAVSSFCKFTLHSVD